MTKFTEKLLSIYKSNFNHSVIGRENEREIFKYYLEKYKPYSVLEIGTFQGATAAFMSQYVDKIYTIDIKDHNCQKCFWNDLGINNIEFFCVKNDKEKKDVIDKLEFDFAFVDGLHRSPGPEVDFHLVKHCGRVLFHDYRHESAYMGVVEIADKLKAEIKKPFAFWNNDIKNNKKLES